jgi:hypothetical protein
MVGRRHTRIERPSIAGRRTATLPHTPMITNARRTLSALLVSCASVTLAVFVTWTFVTGGANPFVKAQPTPIAVPTRHATNIQGGVILPRWGQDAYGMADPGYTKSLSEIAQQTGARWVEMTITLYQQDSTSTQVYRGESSTSPENLQTGIAAARAAGYHVYVVPDLTLESTDWAGLIDFPSHELAQQWFDNYQLALAPYLQAAAQAGVLGRQRAGQSRQALA